MHGRLSSAAGVGEAARARTLRMYVHLRALYVCVSVCVRARAAGIPRRRLLSLARVLNPLGKIDNGWRRASIPDKQARRQAGRQAGRQLGSQAVGQAGRRTGRTQAASPAARTRQIFGFGISRERRPARRYAADDAALDRSTRFLLSLTRARFAEADERGSPDNRTPVPNA